MYDALNRVVKYKNIKGEIIEYIYDELGNLTRIVYPDKKYVNYGYNAANLLIKVTDWSGRETSYEYDKNHRLIKTTRANGTVQTIEYDKAGQVKKALDADKDGKVINLYEYEYDLIGNIIKEKSTSQSVPILNEEINMEYDKANRLISYNGQEVIHDKDGNMTRGPLGGEMVDFEYDSRNRLIKAGGTTYEYDAENIRTAKIENGKRTEYIIAPNLKLSQILQQKDSEGKVTTFIYGNGLIAQEENFKYKVYHSDNRGSTTKISDIDGNVTDSYTYGSYGELLSHEGSTQTPFLYNGRDGVITDSNGLYYMRARYYNPDIKRFINQDILSGNIRDGRTLNRYAYVNGNPISLVDPYGLSPEFGNSILDLVDSFLEKTLPLFGYSDLKDPILNLIKTGLTGDSEERIGATRELIGTAIRKWGSKKFKTLDSTQAINKQMPDLDKMPTWQYILYDSWNCLKITFDNDSFVKKGKFKNINGDWSLSLGNNDIKSGFQFERDFKGGDSLLLGLFSNINLLKFEIKGLNFFKNKSIPSSDISVRVLDIGLDAGIKGDITEKNLSAGVKAKISALSGDIIIPFKILDHRVEIGVTGDLGTIGCEAVLDITEKGFFHELNYGVGVGGGTIFKVSKDSE